MIFPRVRRTVSGGLRWLLARRENLLFTSVCGAGVILALSLNSSLRSLAIALAGVAVYFLVIVVSPLKGLLLWLVSQKVLDVYLNISLGFGIPDLSLTRLCLALITVLLLARAAIRRQPLQPLSRFDAIAFLFMLGMLQCGFRGNRGLSSLQDVFDIYWVPILSYFAVKNLVTSRKAVYLVLYAVAFFGLYNAIYAIYEMTTGDVLLDPNGAWGITSYEDSNLLVLQGIWGGNGGFGKVFVMSIPVGFYFYLKSPSSVRKGAWAVCLALLFVGLYFTYKRAAWLAALVVVFVMQLFYPQFRRLFIVLAIVVGIACFMNWDSISTSTVYTDRINSKLSTSEDRTGAWEYALEFWSARPLLGHGLNQWGNLARAAGIRHTAVESEHFGILVAAGLVGFVPYVGLLLSMAYDGLRHYRGQVTGSLADRDLVAVFWGILLGYAVTTATEITSHLIIPALLFTVAGAVIYSRGEDAPARPEREQWVQTLSLERHDASTKWDRGTHHWRAKRSREA